MKTYILDTLNRYKRLSESLDVKTMLCDKTLLVFNEMGNKESLHFMSDGTLISSVNGFAQQGTWRYIPSNKSLMISIKDEGLLLHPAFIDNTVLALQQDGTNRFAFLIDEAKCDTSMPKSLSDLNSYFKRKEQEKKREEQEREIERQRIEQETEDRRRAEQRKEEKENHRMQIREAAYKIYPPTKYKFWISAFVVVGAFSVMLPFLTFFDPILIFFNENKGIIFFTYLVFFIIEMILVIMSNIIYNKEQKQAIERFCKDIHIKNVEYYYD